MAKSKSFFGLRKGSTKTLTFQVVNGAQVTKDRVAFVKNPRTESQMANRCLMATASAAYRAMREIVDHSFEGYTYGQQNMSQFIAQNITLLRNNAAIGATEFGYNRYRDRAFHPGAYKISKGSLTPTLYSYGTGFDSENGEITIVFDSLPANYTIDNIGSALGLAVGEMSTICFIYKTPNDKDKFGFIRIKRVGTGNNPISTASDIEAGFQFSSNLGNVVVEEVLLTDFTIKINTPVAESMTIYSGVIYSRHTSQGWLRSTAYIGVPDGVELTPDYDTALATYPQGTNYILNGGTVSGDGGKSPTPTPVLPTISLGSGQNANINTGGTRTKYCDISEEVMPSWFQEHFHVEILDENNEPIELTRSTYSYYNFPAVKFVAANGLEVDAEDYTHTTGPASHQTIDSPDSPMDGLNLKIKNQTGTNYMLGRMWFE